MPLAWKTSKRTIWLGNRPLVMGILNVTPDSFSDGGLHFSLESALECAEQMIADGADIIDIGGESTRPGSLRVDTAEEIRRTIPVIEAIVQRFGNPVSIDTSRAETAEAAVQAGAEIINDVSGLRFDERIADIAATHGCGLVLMHSRGAFDEMHSQEPVSEVVPEVTGGLRQATEVARSRGVSDEQIVLDVGIGFGKTCEQNLELIGKLDTIIKSFSAFPFLMGVSRKSFIGKVLDGRPAGERLGGSLAAALISVLRGARIVRVHDVKETVDALKVTNEILRYESIEN